MVIKEINPTVFFIGEEKNLKQGIDIVIENKGSPSKANMEIRIGSKKENVDLGRVGKGKKSHRIYIPEIQEKMDEEFILFAKGKVQDNKTTKLKPQRHWNVYLVHLSHHDIGYTNLPTNVLRIHDGFMDDILCFCEETENWPFGSKFKYVVEQSCSVTHFIKNRPKEAVDKLIRFIKKGQIEITAFFANEISELCSHEELIRLMYPSFELKRKYGIPIRSAELDDIPGLSWGLATVLAGAGVKYFVPALSDYFGQDNGEAHALWNESSVLPHDVPGVFLWQGPDGAKVLFWYGDEGVGGLSWWDYQAALRELPDMLNNMKKKGYPFDVVRCRFRSGHSDNSPPASHLSYIAREWNEHWAYPKLIIATNSDFFERLEKKCGSSLPVIRGELPNTDFTIGAISTAKEIGIDRITHEQLQSAEKFAAIAATLTKYVYPGSRIREAYQNILFYDEHSWGMDHPIGSAQDAVGSEKSSFAYRAAALSQDVLSKSLNKIVDEIRVLNDGYYVVVFNSLSWERTDIVRAPFKTETPCGRPMHLKYGKNEGSPILVLGSAIGRNIIDLPIDFIERTFELIDVEIGKKIPYQIVRINDWRAPVPSAPYRYALGKVDPTEFFEIVFLAENVPPLGYRTYRLIPSNEIADFASNIEVRETSIQNRFFKVILDSATGAIKSIYDKDLGREIIDQDAPYRLNQLIVQSAETGKEEKPSIPKIYEGQKGDIYGSLIISGKAPGCPQITEEIILYDKIKRIDIANRILKDSRPFLEIYFAFPFNVENPTFHFEGSNSVIEPLKDQFPGSNSDYYTMQHWASVSDGEIGITLSSIEAPVVEFGGLRSGCVSKAHHGITPPGFAHHFLQPGDFKKGHMYSYVMNNNFRTNFQPIQVGERLFRYSITTHKGNWKKGRVYNFGWGFQNPFIPVYMKGKKEGVLSTSHSFCYIDQPNVLLLALKEAEDKDGLILRLIETEGRDTEVTVRLPFLKIARVYETNLVEENERILFAQKHKVIVPINAFGIRTIRIRES